MSLTLFFGRLVLDDANPLRVTVFVSLPAQHALERIQDGSFGSCAACKESIRRRRLQALPWADCIQYQEQFELGIAG
jgi:hypothetical protein